MHIHDEDKTCPRSTDTLEKECLKQTPLHQEIYTADKVDGTLINRGLCVENI